VSSFFSLCGQQIAQLTTLYNVVVQTTLNQRRQLFTDAAVGGVLRVAWRCLLLLLCVQKICCAMWPLLLLRGTQCAGWPLCAEQQRQPLCLLRAEVLGEMLWGMRRVVCHRCV
jgi:hypothetical protein